MKRVDTCEYTLDDIYEVICKCGHSKRTTGTAGKVAEHLRKLGWSTKKGRIGNPLEWICPNCKD